MGVLGLYSYFESKSLGNRRSWTSSRPASDSTVAATPIEDGKQQQLHDVIAQEELQHSCGSSRTSPLCQQSPPKERYFILDGNAYIHHLYCGQFEWIWGGQYPSFVNFLTAHVSALISCGFRLQFLFDGPLPLQKLQTRLNRDTEKIHKMARVMADLEHYHVLGLHNEGADALFSANKIGQNGAPTRRAGSSGGAASRSSGNFLIPPLVMEVTLQTLRSLGVDLLICDGEADGLVAQLAMERSLDEMVEEAYAVSKDSDYFIYHTGSSEKGGYIPLDSLFVSTDPGMLLTTITATVYSQSTVAEHLGIRPEFLPLFASLTGNDYLRPDIFEDQIAKSHIAANGQKLSTASNTNHARIRATAGFLRQYGAGSDGDCSDADGSDQVVSLMNRILEDRKELYSVETDERRQELRSVLVESIQQYSCSPSSGSVLNPAGGGLLGSAVPSTRAVVALEKMKRAFRSGQFSFKLMDVVCNKMFWCTPFLDDTDRESAWLVSREMRRWIYGILARNLLTEERNNYDKDGNGREAEQTDDEKESTISDVVEYVRRGDHLSAEIVTGASSLELDEVLKASRVKASKKAARRVSVMDVDPATPTAYNDLASEEQDKSDIMSIDIPFEDNCSMDTQEGALDKASRTSLFLGILGADTLHVRALPKPFMVLAATLRYLINALAHSKTRSASASVANFEVIAVVASVLFLRERYYPETIVPSTSRIPHEEAGPEASISNSNKSTSTAPSSPAAAPFSNSTSGLDEAPPLTKRSLHLSTQYQHALGTVSLLANALHLEDMIPPLAWLFDGLLFQQTLALARGGTLLEQRMIYPESVSMYHRILAAVEEDFIDTGEIDVVVVFRAKKAQQQQQQQQADQLSQQASLGIFGPDLEPVNQPSSASVGAASPTNSSSLKATKSSGIQKKSSGSKKRSGGGSGGSNSRSGSGSARGGGSSGGNMFNVLSLGCEF